MRPAAAVLALALALLAAAAARAADETEAIAEAVWRWPEGVFRWHYSRAGEPEWLDPGLGLQLFLSAAAQWEVCGLRIEFSGETEAPPGRMDGANVLGWAAAGLPARMRGITLKRRAGGALIEADVLINAANRDLRASPELLRKVILHEFGHALGLVHSPDCGDVMSFGARCRVPPRELPQAPGAGDLAQCAARYGAPQPARRRRRGSLCETPRPPMPLDIWRGHAGLGRIGSSYCARRCSCAGNALNTNKKFQQQERNRCSRAARYRMP